MTDNKTAASSTDAQAAQPRLNAKVIDAVEVSIDAYLGAARMTVAELSALGAGSVVTLDAALNGEVELRLGSTLIGRGELVAVGDKFAVRITELSA